MNKKDLTLVVGAGGGIGSSVSQHMISKNQNVLLLDYDLMLLDQLKEKVDITACNVMFERVDITNYREVEKVVEKYEADYELVNLINCAGISVDGTSEVDLESFRKMMEVNFWGSVYVIKAILPYMRKRNRGYLITLVSQSGKRARPKTGAYAATKFALMGYIEALQKELAGSGIKVSALCPGMVNTRQTDDEPDYEKSEMIQPCELLGALDFLLSVPDNVSVKEVICECVQQLKEQ